MCGIVGIARIDSKGVNPETLDLMRDLMVHRGPDGSGTWVAGGIGLGHRRLAVIDLSPRADQPMTEETDRVVMVFNGEIYNHLELRQELISAGYRFHSNSDTEVLIAGYLTWGLEVTLKKIRGMYAFALWDKHTETLLLARDPLGVKPLFIFRDRHQILFASDPKAIMASFDKTPEINFDALREYFYYYYISQQQCMFEGMFKAQPGYYYAVKNGTINPVCYWEPDYSRKQSRPVEEWKELLDQQIRQAIRRRLIGDVPIGAFLSGGVDSSVVSAMMAQESSTTIRTFCAGFSASPDKDERAWARTVANHIGSDHTELDVGSDLGGVISDVVWHYGEPFADSSAVPSYLIAREARKFVTVVMTGDGGDEILAGYRRYQVAQRAETMNPMLRQLLALGLGVMRHPMALLSSHRATRWKNTSETLKLQNQAHTRFINVWSGLARKLFAGPLAERHFYPERVHNDLLDQLSGPTHVDRAMEFVLRERMPSDYLTKVDVATMAHSLEARSPFLDIDLLDITTTIPSDMLLKGGQSKFLLKQIFDDMIPGNLSQRPKQGFEIPVGEWFRQQWKGQLQDLLLNGSGVKLGFFQMTGLRDLLASHNNGQNLTSQIWSVLVFEIWLRLFVERTLVRSDRIFSPAV
ncbi:MAG: asparagine synthase (glutamine-hydrolyzing) [Lysobacterales bacterium]